MSVFEPLESRTLLAADVGFAGSPWQNAANPVDVNLDQVFSPLDLMLVLNRIQSGQGAAAGEGEDTLAIYPDVSGDGVVSPADLLIQFNYAATMNGGMTTSSGGSSSSSYSSLMTSPAAPSPSPCELDFAPPIVDYWFRQPDGELTDHAVEGSPILLDVRVLESLPCPTWYPGNDRISWDIDWGDGTAMVMGSLGATTSGFQAAFTHTYVDDDPTATPVDIYHLTVTARDKDGTKVVPIELPVHNADPKLVIDSIVPIDIVLAWDADGHPTEWLNPGQLDESESFRVTGHVTDPGLLDTHTGTIKADLNWDGDFDDPGEVVSISGGGRHWEFSKVLGPVLDDGQSGVWDNQIAIDNLQVIAATEDDDTGAAALTASVSVVNIPVDFASQPTLEVLYSTILPVTATISGAIRDFGKLDSHQVVVKWADGQETTQYLPAGVSNYTTSRTISDATQLVPALVKVIDDDTEGAIRNVDADDRDSVATSYSNDGSDVSLGGGNGSCAISACGTAPSSGTDSNNSVIQSPAEVEAWYQRERAAAYNTAVNTLSALLEFYTDDWLGDPKANDGAWLADFVLGEFIGTLGRLGKNFKRVLKFTPADMTELANTHRDNWGKFQDTLVGLWLAKVEADLKEIRAGMLAELTINPSTKIAATQTIQVRTKEEALCDLLSRWYSHKDHVLGIELVPNPAGTLDLLFKTNLAVTAAQVRRIVCRIRACAGQEFWVGKEVSLLGTVLDTSDPKVVSALSGLAKQYCGG